MYHYSIQNDFPNQAVVITTLEQEIRKSAITISLTYTSVEEDDVFIEFSGTLDTNDKGILDTVIANHQGIKPPTVEVLETVMIIPTKLQILNVTDWHEIGGVVMRPEVWGKPMSELVGQVTGEILTDGVGTELSILEKGVVDREIIQPPYQQMNTLQQWAPFAIFTNQPFSPSFHSYLLRARRGGANDAWVRHCTLSVAHVQY